MNDQIKLAYLAGFVDGEGSIAIGINNGNNGRKRYYLRLTVHQVDRRPLQILLDTFGGSIRFHTNRPPNTRDIYEWTVISGTARDAIVALRPYLVVKDKQADVGIQFQSLLDSRGLPRTTALSTDELAQRHNLYEKIRDLKWEITTQ